MKELNWISKNFNFIFGKNLVSTLTLALVFWYFCPCGLSYFPTNFFSKKFFSSKIFFQYFFQSTWYHFICNCFVVSRIFIHEIRSYCMSSLALVWATFVFKMLKCLLRSLAFTKWKLTQIPSQHFYNPPQHTFFIFSSITVTSIKISKKL